MPIEVSLPKMSDHMETGKIVRWHVQPGDLVARGQVLFELETDKAVGEVEAAGPGVLQGVRFSEGDLVPVGEVVAYILQPGEPLPDAPGGGAAASTAVRMEDTRPAVPGAVPGGERASIRATPLARRVARDLGVDLGLLTGTGPRGIVRDADVRAYASQAQEAGPDALAPSTADMPASEWLVSNPSTALPLNSIQRITAQRMTESFAQVPHFSLQTGVDMTRAVEALDCLRAAMLPHGGEKPTITALLVKVCAAALRRCPNVNATFAGDHVQQYVQINIGVAVGTENGLVVPVIHQADQRSLAEITEILEAIKAKAKTLRFHPEEVSGGTFTISNLGMYGVDRFQAVINPPQSAILAVGRMKKTPVGLPDDTIALRPMMELTLSVDHRVLDGYQAAQFLGQITTLLEQPYRMLS